MIRGIFFCAMLTVNYAISAQTIITDRPDQTESSSTVEQGSLQIESGILLGSAKDDLFSEEVFLAPTMLWRYGITNGVELRLLTEFASVKNKLNSQKINGIADLQIGTKVQILKKKEINTEIAFLSHAILPTAKDELSLNEIGTINKLSISHVIKDNVGLGYNIGYDYFGYGNGDFTYSLAVGIGITDAFGFYLEPYGAIVDFETHEASFDAGIAYLLQDNVQLDFSFGTGINHTMNYISVGCSINIAKSKDNE